MRSTASVERRRCCESRRIAKLSESSPTAPSDTKRRGRLFRASASRVGSGGRSLSPGGAAMRSMIFTGWLFLAATAVGRAEPPAAAPVQPRQAEPLAPIPTAGTPFTGPHAADLVMGPGAEPQPVSFCQTDACADRYVDLRFLFLYPTSPVRKEPLIQFTSTSSTGVQTDTYRTGVVNTHESTGLHFLSGIWR